MSNGKWLLLRMKKMQQWMLPGLLLRWVLFINDWEIKLHSKLGTVVILAHCFLQVISGSFYNHYLKEKKKKVKIYDNTASSKMKFNYEKLG